MGGKTAQKKKLAVEKRKANENAKKRAQETDKMQREENTDEITASKVPRNDRDQTPTNTRRVMDEGNTKPTKTNKDHAKYIGNGKNV